MVFIKIENLEVGMILKNYKELCNVLDVEVLSGGNAKKKQMKWFEEYFSYRKEGNKFIITTIHNTNIKPMEDNRIGGNNAVEYIENIQTLILDILVQDENKGKIFLSKNKLFKTLEMVNNNYIDANRRQSKLSKFLDIDENTVQEWYDTTGGLLERNLESALKRLASQSLIMWSREITVCELIPIRGSEYIVEIKHKNKYGETESTYEEKVKLRRNIREATDSEKRFILKTEKEIMESKSIDCSDKQEVIKKGLWAEFEEKVKEIVLKECDILYYFQSYKILSNPEHIQKKWDQINNLQLTKNERKEQKDIINTSIMDRIESNAKSRQTNAISKYEYNISPKLSLRISDEYVDDNIKLSKTLINKEAKDIREDVKKVQLE